MVFKTLSAISHKEKEIKFSFQLTTTICHFLSNNQLLACLGNINIQEPDHSRTYLARIKNKPLLVKEE
jgi:hypothetical protein